MIRPLPVTLIGGLLGAGKTSLLHYLLAEHQGGHLAVLVEKSDELGLDLRALRGLCGAMGRKYDVVEEIADAAQLVAAVEEIARGGRHEQVVIESSGLTLPSYWARALAGAGEGVRLEQVVVLVDLLDFADCVQDPARREFLQAQVAAADLIVLNKCDLAGEAERDGAVAQLRAMNPAAQLVDTAYGEVRNLLPAPGMIGMARNKSGPDALLPERPASSPPELEAVFPASLPPFESVVYRAQRPFHPQRFWNWFNAPHAGLVRAKGIVWLATRNLLVGGVSRAGRQNSAGAAGIWWAALPREEWPTDPGRLMEMQKTWREPYGDRRQELVLTGLRGPTGDAARKLNLCLLSDAEFAQADWRGLPDPFPAWDLEE
jgi:G3E family GTPase